MCAGSNGEVTAFNAIQADVQFAAFVPRRRKKFVRKEKLETSRGDSLADVMPQIEPDEVHQ